MFVQEQQNVEGCGSSSHLMHNVVKTFKLPQKGQILRLEKWWCSLLNTIIHRPDPFKIYFDLSFIPADEGTPLPQRVHTFMQAVTQLRGCSPLFAWMEAAMSTGPLCVDTS